MLSAALTPTVSVASVSFVALLSRLSISASCLMPFAAAFCLPGHEEVSNCVLGLLEQRKPHICVCVCVLY